MFEHRRESLVPKHVFLQRLLRSFAVGMLIIFSALILGILGYHHCEGLGWLDSLLNAAMILSGMGPVNEINSRAGKWFASFYALFSGVVFITTIGVAFAPIVHRMLHKFHLEFGDE